MRRFIPFLTLLILGSLSLTFSSRVAAQWLPAPALMNFQGRLARPDGTPVSDGTYSIRFSLWDAASGGTEQWNQTMDTLAVANGVFDVLLDVSSPATLFQGNLWLEIKIGTDAPLTPRQRLVSVAYAMKSNSVSNGAITAASIADGVITADKFAPGIFNPIAWLLGGNSGVTSGFLGTTDNNPLEFRVNNRRAMRYRYGAGDFGIGLEFNSMNLLGGAEINSIGAGVVGATIGGGGADYDTGTDYPNSVTAYFGTVGGGAGNTAGGTYATVAGGYRNTANNSQAVTIGGGEQNTASGLYATVGGGFQNTASGLYATVPGGTSNTAAGLYSFAAGGRAKANHSGTFVWKSFDNTDFASTASDQFLISAPGGVGINKNNPAAGALDVNGSVIMTGLKLPTGAGAGKVLASDAAGIGTWNTLTSLISPGSITNAMIQNVDWSKINNPSITNTMIQSVDWSKITNTPVFNYWNLAGNSGTDPASQFLGTLDAQPLVFRTSNTEKMRLLTNGNLGIGTQTPIAPLSFADTLGDKINLYGPLAAHFGLGVQTGLLQIHSASSLSDIAFGFGSSGGFTDIMRIKGTGNVGIGTTIPAAKLDVAGTVQMTGLKLPTGAGASKVLTSDASGVGTWNVLTSLLGAGSITNAMIQSVDYSKINNAPAAGWNLAGNSGTNPATQYLGTLDIQPLVFRTSNIERMRLLTNGNLGIGTQTPVAPLSFPDTVGAKISLYGQTTSNYGLGIQANQLQIYTDQVGSDVVLGYNTSGVFTERMRVKGSGNVGIGTAAPAAKLDVAGTVQMTGLKLSAGAASGRALISDASGNGTWQPISIVGLNAGGDLTGTYPNPTIASNAITTAKIADSAITTLKIADNAVTTLKITDSAVTTPKLANSAVTTAKIADGSVTNTKIADSAVTTLKITDNAVTTAKIADSAITTPKIADNAVTTLKITDSAVTTLKIADSSVTNTRLADDAASLTRVSGGIMTSNGFRIGIGTTTPTGLLDVAGPIANGAQVLDQQTPDFAGTNSAINDIWQSFTPGTSGLLSQVDFRTRGLPTNVVISLYAGEGTSGPLLSTHNVTFASASFSWQGFLLTNPTYVTAGQKYTLRFTSPGGTFMLAWANTDPYPGGYSNYGNGTSTDINFRTYVTPTVIRSLLAVANNGNIGIQTATPGNYALDVNGNARVTALTQSSDGRWKHNVTDLENPLDAILNLHGVAYEWKRDTAGMNFPEGRQIGFIAQEVEKVLPELVSTDANGYKSVAYANVVPVLVEAVKTLKKNNDQTRGENAAMKKENAELKARLEALEAAVQRLTAQPK